VIFSLLAGAASLGMFGLLIALPLTASLVILAREFVLPVLAELADKDRGGARAS
jgi:predicted PurR-regulated permease PerM